MESVNKNELSNIIRRFGKQLIKNVKLLFEQNKALFNIVQCRTSSLGGHEEVCDNCGKIRYSYNSCGDRHCPKCQLTKQALWIDKLIEDTLPVKHFHIIFTVPHCLNKIALNNNKDFYNLLFENVWKTLHSFGYTHYGVETGAIAILHTWGQNLNFHPHIHCIVPAAGYSLSGKWRNIGKYDNYLYPVHQLSATFKGKFLDSLKRNLRKCNMFETFNNDIQNAYKTTWVVFCEASLAKAEHVINYLGQYTHRVAISNNRIINITDTHVTFIAKDYRDKAQKKPVTLEGVEFLRRFCLHIMPRRFVRIRRYGIYNNTLKRNMQLQFTVEQKILDPNPDKDNKKIESKADKIIRITGFDKSVCPCCKKGKMVLVRELPRIRSPQIALPLLLKMYLL